MLQLITFVQARLAVLKDEKGATAVEYGLMVALIAVAIMVTVGLIGTELNTLFTSVKDKLIAA